MKTLLFSISLIWVSFAFAQPNIPKIHCNSTWLIVVDTSENYGEMAKVAKSVEKKYELKSDTTKTYNKEKNLICLTNVFDPIMAGKYSRRTIANDYVSLEYLKCYQTVENDSTFGDIQLHDVEIAGSTIAVIAGIFTKSEESRALKLLEELKKEYPKAFMIKRNDLDCYWVHY